MSKFVLIVDLEINPEHIDVFLQAANGQAENSVRLEPGCHRFDIVRSREQPHKVTHYEVFEDEAAFQTHAQMPHTAAFGARIQPWLVGVEMRQGDLVTSIAK